jgi:predicted ATP-grasp superfamily ATP-dependent carboligase
MRLHAFDLNEPVPELNQPHAFGIIQPWTDISKVGSLVLSCLESSLGAKDLGKLARPGDFFDFTRYRPTLIRKENHSEINVPNTVITYGTQSGSHDFLFLRLLEPHMQAEEYIDSVVELLNTFGVKRYYLIGAMYDMVPYTRPVLVTGSASNPELQKRLALGNIRHSDYQGPTTILSIIRDRVTKLGIETCNMIAHLPGYFMMEDDYRGAKRLMEVISSLYGFAMPQEDLEKANQQEEQVRLMAEQIMEQEPRLRQILKQLEDSYDSRFEKDKPETQLSPEVEKFLQDLERRFRQE